MHTAVEFVIKKSADMVSHNQNLYYHAHGRVNTVNTDMTCELWALEVQQGPVYLKTTTRFPALLFLPQRVRTTKLVPLFIGQVQVFTFWPTGLRRDLSITPYLNSAPSCTSHTHGANPYFNCIWKLFYSKAEGVITLKNSCFLQLLRSK